MTARGTLLAALPLLAALSCLACAHIPEPNTPGIADGYPIESVRLEGATAINEGELVSGLANRPPEWIWYRTEEGLYLTDKYFRYDELQTELDRRRIRSFYEREGYFGVEVEGPDLKRVGDGADRLEVTWTIEEGEPARLKDVVLEDAPEELDADLRAAIAMKPGGVYTSADFDDAQKKLRALLVRRGYATAEVEGRTEINRETAEALAIFDIDAGPLIHFRGLEVRGNVRTPTSAVTVRKTWEPGDVFDPAELEQFRGRLYSIDQYGGVRLDYAEGRIDGDETEILATVDELERNELQLGAGGGFDQTNISLRLRGRYKRRNFPLPLTNLIIDITPTVQILRSSRQGTFSDPKFTPQARVSLVWYDFLFPRLELDTNFGYEFQQLEAYEWSGLDVGQALSRPLFDDRLRVGVGWRLHQYTFGDTRVFGPSDGNAYTIPTPQEVIGITSSQSVFVIHPALTYEGRDDPLNPREGVFLSLGADAGLATGGSSAGFLLLQPEVRGYVPLGSRLVLAARVMLSTNLQGQLPAPRRLYSGGANSQRGFSQRRLGPSADLLEPARGCIAEGETPCSEVGTLSDRELRVRVRETVGGQPRVVQIPIGGETLLEVNFEARLRLFKLFGFWLGIAAFIDGADLGQRVADLQIPNLHYAAGGGLRYTTPIGALRADYGYRLNRQSDSFSCTNGQVGCGAFHISIGQAF